MATVVSPTDRNPKHHVSLTDGTNVVGFILRDQYGKRNERAFRRFPHTASALKTFQGDSKWSDQEFPYMSIAQDNFSGGRGNESFDSDKSMFRDSFRASTFREDGVTRGGV
jgi:hypothetical protein